MKFFPITAVAALGLACSVSSMASTGAYRSMVVNSRSGVSLTVNLEASMQLSFTADSLIADSENYRLAWSRADISGWQFSTLANPDMPGLKPGRGPQGDGSWQTPYNVAAYRKYAPSAKGIWLTGYIVGSFSGSSALSKPNFGQDGHVAANLLLASTPDCTDPAQCVPVQLQFKSPVRPELNLADNPTHIGREVSVLGNSATVGTLHGISEVTEYNWGPQGTTGIAAVDNDRTLPLVQGGQVIYDGLPAGTLVMVSDASGRSILSETLPQGGAHTVDLSSFSAGIYVVTVNGISLKIAVKP